MCQVWQSVIIVEWYLEAKKSPHYVSRGLKVKKLKNLGPIFFITTYLEYARHYR